MFKRSKVIMDIDDLVDQTENGKNILLKLLFFLNKTRATEIWCGNEYLLIHSNSTKSKLVRTTIPEDLILSFEKNRCKIKTFGWTGQKSTLFYLEGILPIFDMLYRKWDFKLVYMSDVRSVKIDSREYSQYLEWNLSSERMFFGLIDTGLMPLSDDQWSEGKCAFKLLQYLENGLPALCSPTMLNKSIATLHYPGAVLLNKTSVDWVTNLTGVLDGRIKLKTPKSNKYFRTKFAYINLP